MEWVTARIESDHGHSALSPWYSLITANTTCLVLEALGRKMPETEVSETVRALFDSIAFSVHLPSSVSNNNSLQLQSNLQLLKYSHKLESIILFKNLEEVDRLV